MQNRSSSLIVQDDDPGLDAVVGDDGLSIACSLAFNRRMSKLDRLGSTPFTRGPESMPRKAGCKWGWLRNGLPADNTGWWAKLVTEGAVVDEDVDAEAAAAELSI